MVGITIVYILIFKDSFPKWWTLSVMAANTGWFIAINEDRLSDFLMDYKKRVIISIASILFIVISYILAQRYSMFWLCLYAIFPTSAYIIIRLLGSVHNYILCIIGGISFELYLIHGIVMMYFDHSLNDAIESILILVLSIIVSLVVKQVMTKNALLKYFSFSINNNSKQIDKR